MVRSFIARYISDIYNDEKGENYGTLLRYFLPEFITNFLLYAMPFWLDAAFIGSLASVDTYATLGVTNSFLHLIIKVGEALSVGTIVLSGQFNGQSSFINVGRTMRDAFWITTILGILFGSALFFGAHTIYSWYGVSEQIIALGVPFLRLRAIGVLCMFIYLALVGFLRGIKNARTPMKIFVFGSILFIFFDYVLIFGKWGFPAMGLQGSAIATIIQYGSMMTIALGYVLFNKKNFKYSINLFSALTDISYVKHLLSISWPVVLDKAIMAWAYVWLGKMIATMGTSGIAAFCVVKDMERFAFLPALAFAQIITFLVSNDVGIKNWDGIKTNITKVLFLASGMVSVILGFFIYKREYIINIFDKNGDFTHIAMQAFPLLSIFIIFDLVQLILSGALRGAGNVRIVMIVRFVTCFCYFVPISYLLSKWTFANEAVKLILLYGSFYLGNALMSIWYIRRLRSERWKTPTV
ncbi:MAG TPA: MATE family efflux transporter [Candidatus Babeliales bacterium]|jgi:MATE family multidrug resistance protein|nr:MATE family efflux transporter [Candidatus Babeliales bacterium]